MRATYLFENRDMEPLLRVLVEEIRGTQSSETSSNDCDARAYFLARLLMLLFMLLLAGIHLVRAALLILHDESPVVECCALFPPEVYQKIK